MSGSVIKRKHCMFFSSTRSSIALLAALIGVSMAGGQASGRESTVGADADGSLATSSATPDPATQGESAADAAGTETGRTETSATDSSAASDAGAVSASVEQDAAATDANEPAENLPKVESRGAEILAADFGPKERAIADRAEARWQALARRDFSRCLSIYAAVLPADTFRRAVSTALWQRGQLARGEGAWDSLYFSNGCTIAYRVNGRDCEDLW